MRHINLRLDGRDLIEIYKVRTAIANRQAKEILHEDRPDLDTFEVFLDLNGLTKPCALPVDEVKARYYLDYGTEIDSTTMNRHLKALGYTEEYSTHWTVAGGFKRLTKIVHKSAVSPKQAARNCRNRLDALTQELAKV